MRARHCATVARCGEDAGVARRYGFRALGGLLRTIAPYRARCGQPRCGEPRTRVSPALRYAVRAACVCWRVQSTTRRITSLRLVSKAAVTVSVYLEPTGVAFSKRAVATGVHL